MALKFHISQIDYRLKDGETQSTILSPDKVLISPFSAEIINSIILNKNAIVFSQGALNITPLLAASYSLKYDVDVISFIPERDFEKQYSRYTKDFFSLLYKKRQNPFHSTFFYNDILWCKGQFNDAKELTKLEIESKPIHGDYQFRRKYRQLMTNNFKTNRIRTTREIVTIPIGKSFPVRILGEKSIQYEGFQSKLEFEPKLYLFESLNEVYCDFKIIFAIIKRLNQEGIHYLLHFSWPYLWGLKEFLDQLRSDVDPPTVLHLGKRICYELKNDFKKPETFALGMSLEGDLWDTQYYPKEIITNSKILLPMSNIYSFRSLNEIENYESQTDSMLSDFNSGDGRINDTPFMNSIINFPPAIDSVVLPSNIKDFDYSVNRYIPLTEIVEKKVGKDRFAFSVFNAISQDLEKSRNLAYCIRGLSTYTTISKFTLLHLYILRIIGEKIKEQTSNAVDKVIILNQFPKLSTLTGLINNLEYLISSLNHVLGRIEFPVIIPSRDTIELRIKNESFTIWKNGKFVTPNQRLIRSHLRMVSKGVDLSMMFSNEESDIKIELFLNVPVGYTELDYYKSPDKITSHIWKGLPVYSITISIDGSYQSKSLKMIYFEKDQIQYRWTLEQNGEFKTIEDILKVHYLLSSRIKQLSNDEIQTSTLIVSGPIPFTTYSKGEVYLTNEFDILFMPFMEIVFFSYPGRNFRYLKKQLNIFKEIVSNTPTTCSIADLRFSMRYSTSINMNKCLSRKSLTMDNNPKNIHDKEIREINDIILDEMLNESKSNSIDRADIQRIKDSVNSIKNYSKQIHSSTMNSEATDHMGKEIIRFKVVFEDNSIDIISFSYNKLLRKISKLEYLLTPAYLLTVGDEVLFIQTSTRESIDEFMLKIFESEDDVLKKSFEPLICLNLFYNALVSIPKYNCLNEVSPFNKLYWLNTSEKKFLLNLINLILTSKASLTQITDLMTEKENNIWSKTITPQELVNIFSKNNYKIDFEVVYEIVKLMGISLGKSTFEIYCKGEIGRHYYFRDKYNLLLIGKFIGNKEIIKDYSAINESGEKIATSLRMIGQSVSRVLSGRSDQLSEMDILIESSIRKCKILSIVE